jgi:hypothetical protein
MSEVPASIEAMTRYFDASDGLYQQLDKVVSKMEKTRVKMSRLHAREAALLAEASNLATEIAAVEAHRDGASMAHRMVAAELGAAVRESDLTVSTRMARAVTLTRQYPAVHTALREGRVSAAHAVIITEAGQVIADSARVAEYASEVLAFAEQETAGRLRPVAKELAEKYACRTIDERHKESRDSRMVKVIELHDGMADLIATLPAVWAFAIKDRLDQMARTIKDAETSAAKKATGGNGATRNAADAKPSGSPQSLHTELGREPNTHSNDELIVRTYDQIRADSLVDMMLASDLSKLAAKEAIGPGTIKARVQVFAPRARVENTINTTSLATQQVPTAGLAGYGPIDTESARLIAGIAASWDLPKVDGATGDVITVDTYRPSAEQRRFLAARDPHCRFPGCRVPIRKCDIDHTVAAADGGPTSTTNLAAVCVKHHGMKHATPWNVTQHKNGVLEWLSPTGRAHRDRPPSRVRFRSATTDETAGGSAHNESAAAPF